VYVGSAFVVKGIVTAMSGPRDEVWDDGVFEYGFGFVTLNPGVAPTPPTPLPAGTGVDPSIPFIRDKAYSFTFYKHDRGHERDGDY
jgi:hypothetical protein